MQQPKTYRLHRCEARHRTVRTWAACAFPRAAWIGGNGSYAVLAWCGDLTVTLHDTAERAQDAQQVIDAAGCGGRCQRRHEVVLLDWRPR